MPNHRTLGDQLSTDRICNMKRRQERDTPNLKCACPVCGEKGLMLFCNIDVLERESDAEFWGRALNWLVQTYSLIENKKLHGYSGQTLGDICFNCSTIFTCQY